jgi:hypothetical protein
VLDTVLTINEVCIYITNIKYIFIIAVLVFEICSGGNVGKKPKSALHLDAMLD